jgi:23S rRNA (uracil1939-C5)-methyltransferase
MVAVCERLVQGGLGFSRSSDGKILLIEGALPGETVECQVDRVTPDYQVAHVTGVLAPSPDRVQPRCPYYGICGGCDLQILSDARQAQTKEDLVRENLRRIGGISSLPSLGVASGPPWGYRCRARFHVRLTSKEVGFLGRRSNTLVPVEDCPVLVHPLRDLLKDKHRLWDAARQVMFSGGGEDGVFAVNAFAGDDGVTTDRTVVHLEAGGVRFCVDGQVFFQGNRFVLPQMGEFVRNAVVGERVMDLYGGVGTFSAFIGKDKQIVLVEKDRSCLRLAKENAPFARSYAGDVKDWVSKEGVDTVVLDPPRIGLDRKVPSLVAGWKPQRVIYMSCNSVTLARDLALFASAGYHPLQMKVFDMYPQTFGQEACVVLGRLE